jgi:hypothetical protein
MEMLEKQINAMVGPLPNVKCFRGSIIIHVQREGNNPSPHNSFQSGNSLQPFDFSLDSRPKNFNPDITKSAVFFFM